jgi:hypothetical protein
MRPCDVYDLSFWQLHTFMDEVGKAEKEAEKAAGNNTVKFSGPNAKQQYEAWKATRGL